ncbi:acyl-ACP--UDP-N-acetylglucosamine O-acyltransferase [Magnetofaba australis]|uniref:Acyl-[acyl-carrier-protein]--UDP-N-acetylglucosamine O-acyltransferase n=1 Tax=Magnetofaba australis IT-1 TaxID=1434232 RepID=A0A1Y2K771_9PROT|nr:acyl-ACP--UDP-N-acetylglucosamine O-acyltransferase [Magnetofaba australis]OSM05167.1 putative acyl-[acyl-carrier-protein]--UDP-N-acetylglucosamine O-acyltransferase [Magnetofaba australis IT-1]
MSNKDANVSIHATAVVDPGAQLADGCIVGPYAVIGPNAQLAKNVEVAAHAVIEGHVEIGEESKVFSFATIGSAPQDIHYADEPTRVVIGKRCMIREYVSINRGTEAGGGLTRVGSDCMIMAYSHIAHDCRVDDHVIMANGATLAGHVELQEHAVIGGLTAIHQFARVGRHAFIGGASAVSLDVAPYASAAGNRAKVTGVNVVGLRRRGFSEEAIKSIRKAHRMVFRDNLRLEQALSEIEKCCDTPEVVHFLEFLQSSQRGICR